MNVLERPSLMTEYAMPNIIRCVPTRTGLSARLSAAIVAAHTTAD